MTTDLTRRAPADLAYAESDQQLVELWLRTKRKSQHTRTAYARDAAQFLRYLDGHPLHSITLGHLLGYAESLNDYAPKSRNRKLSAVKSLLTFGQKIGYLTLNVGAALELEQAKNTLAERILSEEDVQKMLALEPDTTKRLLLRVLYASGGRVSEVCALCWRDATASGDAGQLVLFGKGGKTRVVFLSAATWKALAAHRPTHATADAPIFATKKGKPLHRTFVHAIVRRAGERAGLHGVSPHWMRHAHGSHALQRGADIKLVQETLGHTSIRTTQEYLHAKPGDSSARYLPV